MKTAERLLAIEDIKVLKACYLRFVDTQDWEGFRRLFTDDAILEFPESMDAPCSIDAFMPALSAMLQGVTTVHHGYTPEIRITSEETASAIWAMDDMLFIPDRISRGGAPWAGVALIRGYGHYHETYQREQDRWLIRTVRLTRVRLEKTMAPQAFA